MHFECKAPHGAAGEAHALSKAATWVQTLVCWAAAGIEVDFTSEIITASAFPVDWAHERSTRERIQTLYVLCPYVQIMHKLSESGP